MPSARPSEVAAGGSRPPTREKIDQLKGDAKAITKLLKDSKKWTELTQSVFSELQQKDQLEKKFNTVVKRADENETKLAKLQRGLEEEKQALWAEARKEKSDAVEQLATVEEHLSEAKEQVEYLTKALAKHEHSSEEAGKTTAGLEAEAESLRRRNSELVTRCSELEGRCKELETANFDLLKHSEKQQKELSSLMEANHQAKESAMQYKTESVRIGNALKDATQKIAEMANFGKKFLEPTPPTPAVDVRPGSRGRVSFNSTTGSGGKNRVVLDPLPLSVTGTQEPIVSPVSGFQKWANFYGLPENGKPEAAGASLAKTLKQSFVESVKKKYGNLIRGWRVLAAYASQGDSLTLAEFSNACHELHLISEKNMKMTFHDFVGNFHGKLTLPDLDSESYRAWSNLRLKLQDLFGSTVHGIREMFGPKASLSAEDFLHCVEHIKVQKGKLLVTYLQVENRVYSDSLVLNESEVPALKVDSQTLLEMQKSGSTLSPDAKKFLQREQAQEKRASRASAPSAAMRRGSPDLYTSNQPTDSPELGGTTLEPPMSASYYATSSPMLEQSLKKEKLTGAQLFENLKRLLIKKYRSLSLAWKTAFDVQGRGHCGSQHFAAVCRGLGFEGANSVWREVVQWRSKSGLLTYADLDPEGAQLIYELKARMVDKYRDFVTAWVVGIDMDGSNRVSEADFVNTVSSGKFGDFSEVESRQLFRLLRSADKKFLQLHDIDVKAGQQLMDGNLPPYVDQMKAEARKQLSRGMSRERRTEFLVRQNSHEIHAFRTEFAQHKRQQLNAKDERRQSRDMGASSKEEFLSFLKRKYGNLPRAWRTAFDTDGNGKVSQQEFFSVCRHLNAFIGDVSKLFSEFDVDQSGILSLAEVDPAAWRILSNFEDKCLEAVAASSSRGAVVVQPPSASTTIGGAQSGSDASEPSGAAVPRGRTGALAKWWSVFFADQDFAEHDLLRRMQDNSAVTATILKIDFTRFQAICAKDLNLHNEVTVRKLFSYFAKEEGSTFLTETDFKAMDIPKMRDMRERKRRSSNAFGGGARSRSTSLQSSKQASASPSENEGASNVVSPAVPEEGIVGSTAGAAATEVLKAAKPEEASKSEEETDADADHSSSTSAEASGGSSTEPEPAADQVGLAKKNDADVLGASASEEEDPILGASQETAEEEEVTKPAGEQDPSAATIDKAEESSAPEGGQEIIIPTRSAAKDDEEPPAAVEAATTTTTSDIDEFCVTFVEANEGDCSRAWGNLFGTDEDVEEAKFVDFCKAVRAKGFQGNLKLLWTKFGGTDTLCPGDMEEKLFF
ncbi:unnamed protein product [Amoebophrya sp. A120]|nr:unnamed protein product [Amoebophrya sp. A120]|eukprot:GSA120T00004870001.1